MIDFAQILPQLTPDVQIETDWSAGRTGLAADVKKLLLLGHKTTAGAAAAGATKRITSVAQAIVDFGKGSEVACMAEVALTIAPRSPIYGVAYAEGGGGAAATANVALTGSTATAPGSLQVTVAGRLVVVGIAIGDTPTTIGDDLVLAINGLPNAPATAANTTGTVAVTARNKGTGGNSIRMSHTLIGGTGISVACAAVLAAGATDGTPTTVLAGLEGDRYHLIAHNLQDVVSVPLLKTDREKQSGVAVQKWGLGIVGCTGTRGTAETLQGTTGVPSYRMQLVWFNECPRPCFELAAAFGACRAIKRANQSLDDMEIPGFTPALDETKWPSSAEIEAALQSGLVPIRSLRDGTTQIVRSIIAKTQASVPYFIDSNPIEISDYADEYVLRLFRERIKGRPLKVGSEPGSPSTITPTRATSILNEALFQLDKADYIQGVQSAIDAGLNFSEVNGTDPNRLDTAFRFWPIAFAHFCALKKTFATSEG